MEELPQWQKKVAQASPETALAVADQMLGLQGKVGLETLQSAYAEVLLELVERAPGPDLVAQIAERLEKIPCYQNDLAVRERFAGGLARRVAGLATSSATAIGQQIAGLKGYGASLPMQMAHGEALFALSSKASKADEIEPLAAQLESIPSFRDCADLQWCSAKMVCNATALAQSAGLAQKWLARLEALPALATDERLQEARQRALRNQERHRQTEVAPSPKPARPLHFYVLAGVGLVGLGLLGGLVLYPTPPTPRATPRVSRVFGQQMDMAQKALAAGDYNSASAFAKISLEMAQDQEAKGQAIELLILVFSRAGQFDKALEYYAKLPGEEVDKRARQRLESARQAFAAKELDQAVSLTAEASGLFGLRHASTQECDRLQAQVLEAQGQLVAAAAVQQRLGDVDAALRLLEQARAYDKLLPLYVSLEPKYHQQLMKTQRLLATARVQECDKLLARTPDKAALMARACLESLQSIEGSQLLQARCWKVLGQAAFKQAHYPEAVAAARQWLALNPSAEAKQQLSLYRQKDAQTVTAEDLMRSENFAFEFPPAIKTNKQYTYLYYLYPGSDYDKKVRERLLQPPRDEFKARLAYTTPDQGIRFEVTSFENDRFGVDFSGGKRRSLAPGVFNEATRFPFNINNPGLDFSGDGHSYNSLNGRFVIHELGWGPENEIVSFAADLIQLGQSNGGNYLFAKIRYHSKFK